jgi:hypothetical protein
MLGRRRMLAAALAVMACRPGKVFAQPEPRHQCRHPGMRSGRLAPAYPATGTGHRVTGGGLATIGSGCLGVGGAEWARVLQVRRVRSAGVRPSPKRDFDAEEPAGAQVMRRTNADSGAGKDGTHRARLRRKAGVGPDPKQSLGAGDRN